jgi:hypothetical protein
VMARREAGPHERWPNMLKGELENNPRKPRNLVRNSSSVLKRVNLRTLSQGKIKKGDDVADDKGDDAVRTSVSQDRVTVTLCIEEVFLRTPYIWLSPHIGQVKFGQWKDPDSQHNTFSSPSLVSHLPAGPPCNLQGFSLT